ncbi:hypothetical protein [Lyngbya confervoides]|uniref:LIM zinc-binding domain-containing protein n=1 Tax=Lyngbya confervoides BDU141951 TaxID=1574623 RepID=A0ABD4T6P5_9CYAN|nr:hypothetical protein [Lyngbya confervoides]MCM1984230.1 hypothetical protein [Lyngbya confervoides BDU141951]
MAFHGKPCDTCGHCVTLRYRIQSNSHAPWQLVCASCWKQIAPNNPDYRYGGTWKAKS